VANFTYYLIKGMFAILNRAIICIVCTSEHITFILCTICEKCTTTNRNIL